eukprot:gene10570-3089_t
MYNRKNFNHLHVEIPKEEQKNRKYSNSEDNDKFNTPNLKRKNYDDNFSPNSSRKKYFKNDQYYQQHHRSSFPRVGTPIEKGQKMTFNQNNSFGFTNSTTNSGGGSSSIGGGGSGGGGGLSDINFGYDEDDLEILKRIDSIKEEIKILNEKEIEYLEISYEMKYNLDLIKLENKLFKERNKEIENKLLNFN